MRVVSVSSILRCPLTVTSAAPPCAPGTFHRKNGLAPCQDCHLGPWQSTYDMTKCEPCPVEWTTSSTTSKSQEACTINLKKKEGINCPACKYLDNNLCIACIKGTSKQIRGNHGCTSCRKGHYQDRPGQKSCNKCPHGQSTEGTVSTAISFCRSSKNVTSNVSLQAIIPCPPVKRYNCKYCVNCPIGQVKNDYGKSCRRCPVAYYQHKPGQTRCLSCLPYFTTTNDGTASGDTCFQRHNGSCRI